MDARGMTGIPRARAAATSMFPAPIADEMTTTSLRATFRASWPTRMRAPTFPRR
jgi:hypothetical protein